MDDDSPDLDTAEKQVRRMLRAYRSDVVAKVTVLAVESLINAGLIDGVELSGQSDLLAMVEDDTTGGFAIVRDLKTSRAISTAMPCPGEAHR